jgi:hypothetical protein
MSARRLLLISNSTLFGRGYLDHAVDEIRDLLGGNRRIVFIPFGLSDRAAYTSRARKRLGQIGYQVMDVGEPVPGTDCQKPRATRVSFRYKPGRCPEGAPATETVRECITVRIVHPKMEIRAGRG